MKKFIKENGTVLFVCLFVLFTTCFAVVLFSESQVPTPFASSGIVAFISALIGVILTVVVTNILLKRQSEDSEQKEKNMKIFEKKQDVYHGFLDQFKSIINDGKITITSFEENKMAEDDELKDLIFQIAYLRLHTDEKNVNEVFSKIVAIIRAMNDFEWSKPEEKRKMLTSYYAELSKNIFEITLILKSDLYDKKDKHEIDKQKIIDLLGECDLFIDSSDFNKIDIQKYFWDELRKQLREKGYSIEEKDFTNDITQYYAKARNRYRYYGFNIPLNIKKFEGINFRVELENDYFFGIHIEQDKPKRYELQEILCSIEKGYKPNYWWAGSRTSYINKLDFWKLNSEGFNKLKNPHQREKLMTAIAEEIDRDIKKFIEIANKEI